MKNASILDNSEITFMFTQLEVRFLLKGAGMDTRHCKQYHKYIRRRVDVLVGANGDALFKPGVAYTSCAVVFPISPVHDDPFDGGTVVSIEQYKFAS